MSDELNARERYLAVMRFEPGVRTMIWEFGYWVAATERWYREGLRRSPLSPPPGAPSGTGVIAEGLPFPFPQSTPRFRDCDISRLLGHDPGLVRVPVNWRFCPAFKEEIIEEDERTKTMINPDGALVRAKKMSDCIPQFIRGPVHDRASWEKLREERFNTDNVLARFPDRWQEIGSTYRDRDYPFGLLMDGFFSLPREMFLVEHLLMAYYTDPELLHDIGNQIAKVWLAVLEEVFPQTDLDYVYFWEDMAFKNGPLISPQLFREFVAPHYKQVTDFLKARGVKVLMVDTDGDCWLLIPEFLEAGLTGMYPFEVQAGMNIVDVRKAHPKMHIAGGLDKTKVAKSKEAIDAELEAKLPTMLTAGGYIPFLDHLAPPDIPWENFCYYRRRVREYVEKYQTQ